ncbi:cytochrome c peroxidase [Candidatus Methylospira mobilis]|uniref:cytochrome c peroxidase n=1 Tax=Candidatus Methylospira mobilis TaxID=1808979 RepID=UPI0028F15658|nr:cytochrome c peroxidase [Candidatus Methylospira mobilis]WNV06295.1 cytochrome c peroxidase [Candidatus Methylospira mobilis]
MPNNLLFALLAVFAISPAAAHEAASATLAPGYRALPFTAPQPGSYILPVLGSAADGSVVDSSGKPVSLHALYDGKIVLLSFIYATCNDVNGCPLATGVLQQIKTRLKNKPQLSGKLRLITISFDPEHDTPEVMRHYGQGFQNAGSDWRFLTTKSEMEILPILQNYQQSIDKEYDAQGRLTGKFSHLLRVFLIDSHQRIRNIYTISVLHPDMILADIETLLRESSPAVVGNHAPESADATDPLRPGDDKSGYADSAYQTHTQALNARREKPADLFRRARQPMLGLPQLPTPKDNPLTPAKIALGRKLFHDRRLSLNQTISCAMCHIPEQGYTSREQATATGIEGRSVRRNAPTLYNAAYLTRLFHDGRESTLENQAWGPLLAANEMGNPSIGYVVDRLAMLADYTGLFQKAFGREAGMETVGQALAAYQRTLVSGNSAFDRWYFGKEHKALSPSAQAGFALFTGKGGCSSCHLVSGKYALFTDNDLHNTGVGYLDSMKIQPTRQPVQVAPGIALDVDGASIAQVAEIKAGDLGRYEITQRPEDRWKYRTPTLRNIALTAPYMHNGSVGELKSVVQFYNRGGIANETLDPRIHALGLSEQEIDALVDFLSALTGSDNETLVADAFAAPIGN